jgi:PPOX class probable F420-dependent enzyme
MPGRDRRRVSTCRRAADPAGMPSQPLPASPTPEPGPVECARRIGYDASADDTQRRVLPMLAGERVAWLSTVRPNGLPHLVPTWFWWDGDALLVFSKPDAVKVRNLEANPRLMVALGDPADDFSVSLIEAEASCDDAPAAVPDAFFAKYAGELDAGRLDPGSFRALYTRVIRIVPTRFLAWRGRGAGHEGPAGRRAGRPGSLLPAWA